MDYKTWKQTKENNNSANYERLETLKKQYGFEVVEEHGAAQKCTIEGICYTPSCENTYRKKFASIKNSGPYCDECAGVNKPRGLLIEEFPEIANSIISNVDLTKITSGSNIKVDFECSQLCSRCKTKHVWNAKINKRTTDRGCPICSNYQKCVCQKHDEFRCYSCKMIKSNSQKICNNHNCCKLCFSKVHDGNICSFAKSLLKNTQSRNNKSGDLTYENIIVKYNQQNKRCYISNVIFNIGYHQNWKMSIERMDENGKYDDDNTLLICCELQASYHRQWNREFWDEFCSYVRGSMNDLPNEDEYLHSIVKQGCLKKTHCYYPRNNTEMNESGQVKCKNCLQWLETSYFYKSRLKGGFCMKCENKRVKIYQKTFIGRINVLYNSSKMTAKKKKGNASIHNININDIIKAYLHQKGRCAYSNIPLCFSGRFQMSLERKDVYKGYIPDNICLIIIPLNVGDHHARKTIDDDRQGSSGWNREKVLWAVEQNPRNIIPKMTTVKEFLSN
jgi:hypothetical protein